MSIINEAIKKARKAPVIKNTDPPAVFGERPVFVSPPHHASETKWTAIVILSLVITASLLGSLVLYRYLKGRQAPSSLPMPIAKAMTSSPAVSAAIPATASPTAKIKAMLELSGIVYESQDKWAIINDKIVREGDLVMGGKLTYIAKDFVKIKEDGGEEFMLDLR